MLKVTVIGAAGRMGKEIIGLTLNDPCLQLVGAIDSQNAVTAEVDVGINAGEQEAGIVITHDLAAVAAETDVCIDFSSPGGLIANTRTSISGNCAVVIGTTGFPDDVRDEIKSLTQQGGRIVMAPNMSVGVNVLFMLSKLAAEVLGENYDIEVVEMHHNLKKDAPSGTAERLGKILTEVRGLSYSEDTRHGRKGITGERTKSEIGIHSLRGGDVVGDHRVIFAANGERLELVHKASSRATFAQGAIRAAKFIVDAEPGLYDMQDVLGL